MKKVIAAVSSLFAIGALAFTFLSVPAPLTADGEVGYCKYLNASEECSARCDEGEDCPCQVGCQPNQ